MGEFEEAIDKINRIETITNPIEKSETYSFIQQIFSSTMCFEFMFQNFTSTSVSGQIALLENTDFWINNNWDKITETEGLCEQLKEFLFSQLPAQTDISQTVKMYIASAQARFFMKTFPDPWGSFFEETFFDGNHLNLEMMFIFRLCKILATPLFNEREFTLSFRDGLVENGVSARLFESIFNGIAALDPYAFLAIGYFSVCFDNSWVGDQEKYAAFGNGMSNEATQANTLEAINLILQSNFNDETKVEIIQGLNIIEVIQSETESDILRCKYSEIVYTLLQIFPETEEIYQSLVETALAYLTTDNNSAYYACLALQSALPKNKDDFTSPIVLNALVKLNAFNHATPSLVPDNISSALLFLIQAGIRENPRGALDAFEQFTQSVEENPLEDFPTGVTYLQFLSNFRKISVNFPDPENYPIDEYVDSFSGLAGEQEEVAEETKYIFYNYYDCLLNPLFKIIPQESQSEVLTEYFNATIQFIFCEIPEDLSKKITSGPLCSFVSKYYKSIQVEPDTLVQLANTGNVDLLRIVGVLVNVSDPSVKNDLISAVLEAVTAQIQGSETGPVTPFFNATSFFMSFSDIAEPTVAQAIGELINEMMSNVAMQYNDGIIGNVLAILPSLNDIGFELFKNIYTYAKNPNSVNGLCRAIFVFVSKSKAGIPYAYKEVCQTPEWHVEMFVHVFELVKGLYEQFVTGNYYYEDVDKYNGMFKMFFACAYLLSRSFPDELYAEFLGFMQQYMSQLSYFPQMINWPHDFLSQFYANGDKREFDLTELIQPIHSFLFSPRFNIHMVKSQIPINYKKLLTNMAKGSKYDVFSQRMKEIMNMFDMDEEFSNQYMRAFEQSSTVSLTQLMEKIISKRANTLHNK